jgi:hypothetical protein
MQALFAGVTQRVCLWSEFIARFKSEAQIVKRAHDGFFSAVRALFLLAQSKGLYTM